MRLAGQRLPSALFAMLYSLLCTINALSTTGFSVYDEIEYNWCRRYIYHAVLLWCTSINYIHVHVYTMSSLYMYIQCTCIFVGSYQVTSCMGGLIPRGVCAHTGYCSPDEPQVGGKVNIKQCTAYRACMSPLGNFLAARPIHACLGLAATIYKTGLHKQP